MISDYRPEIDGLRAVAVLAVLLYHIDHNLLPGGYFGVDVFFVISGYLISQRIFSELQAGNFSILSFYHRRARRILPALIVVLLASSIAAAAILPPAQLIEYSYSALAAFGFFANIFFWFKTDYFAEPADLTPLLHTWSLSVEEQFYIFFPIIILIAWRYFRRAVTPLLLVATAAACVLSYRAASNTPNSAFYLFQYRAWELMIGVAIARLGSRRKAGYGLPELGLGLIGTSFFLFGSRFPFLPVVGSALVIMFPTAGLACTVLRLRPMLTIGLMSYSLYLWHQPVFALARAYMINAPTMATYAILAVLCIGLSYASLTLVERPLRDSRFPLHKFIWTIGLASTCLVAVAAAVIVTKGFPQRYTDLQIALLDSKPERNVAIVDGRVCRRMRTDDACIIGNANVEPTFAILGDSHAEALTGSLSDMLRQKSLSAYVYTYPACPFIIGVGQAGTNSPCPQFVNDVLKSIASHKIRNVIINDRATAYITGTRFNNGEGGIEPGENFPFAPSAFMGTDSERSSAVTVALHETLKQLLDSGVRVFYVLPIPEAGWNVPRVMAKLMAKKLPPPTTGLDTYLARHSNALAVAQELNSRAGFIPIYSHEAFCNDVNRRCRLSDGKQIYYSDTDHLSGDGAKLIVDAIADAIQKSDRNVQ